MVIQGKQYLASAQKMKIVKKESFTAVGLKVEAGWEELHTKMPKAWETFKKRVKEIDDRKSDTMMDLSLDISDGQYTQLIGVPVEDTAYVPKGMLKVIIPSQRYVWYKHEGDLTGITESFGKMYEWAEENDISAKEFKMDMGYLPDGSESKHDLYVKIS